MSSDNEDEVWCRTNFLNASALRLAVVIRAELLEVMQRIELPVSSPAFGCQDNCTNIKRALISGFFLKVNTDSGSVVIAGGCLTVIYSYFTRTVHGTSNI